MPSLFFFNPARPFDVSCVRPHCSESCVVYMSLLVCFLLVAVVEITCSFELGRFNFYTKPVMYV